MKACVHRGLNMKELDNDQKKQNLSKSPKVLIIGLDGVPFDLVNSWTIENKLPNISKIKQKGVWGTLNSVLPCHSLSNWTSFMTGKNPAKHGHFDFVTRVPGSRTVAYINSAISINGKTLWDILGDYGKKLGVMNVPVTYPVREVNGFMIPDWLTPSTAKNPTYPPELCIELNKKFGDFLFEYRGELFEKGKENEEQLLQKLYYSTEKRAESALFLMEKYDWDFFMIVFTGTDTIQHFLWHYTDSMHPLHDTPEVRRRGDEILKYYQKMDQIIGNFLNKIDSDTRVIILSDHGFGPFIKKVNINKVLLDLGLLVINKKQLIKSPSHGFEFLNFLAKFDCLNLRKLFPRKLRQRAIDLATDAPIDWSRTRAYSGSSAEEGGVYINLKGRDPKGVVTPGDEYNELRELISEKLTELTDPDTGKKVIEKVFKKENLYCGPYLDRMPDLLLVMARGYEPIGSFDRDNLFVSPARRTGTHRSEGIFLAMGDGIIKGKEIENASILDVCPTILYILDSPVPSDMDGKVLDIFNPSYRAENPIRHIDVSSPTTMEVGESKAWADAEEDEIKERLKALGYIE